MVLDTELNADPIIFNSQARQWTESGVVEESSIASNTENFTVKWEESLQTFECRLDRDNESSTFLLARVGLDGAIADHLNVRKVALRGASETGAYFIKEYSDGTRLVETAIIVNNAPKDLEIFVKIIVGGVMFADGSLVKKITA